MRTLVRFYKCSTERADYPGAVPSAVIHHVDCARARHVGLKPGQRAKADYGWWERFYTEDEAIEAAEAQDRRRVDRETYVQYWPKYCRNL